jgi:hypothetical protein
MTSSPGPGSRITTAASRVPFFFNYPTLSPACLPRVLYAFISSAERHCGGLQTLLAKRERSGSIPGSTFLDRYPLEAFGGVPAQVGEQTNANIRDLIFLKLRRKAFGCLRKPSPFPFSNILIPVKAQILTNNLDE